MTQRDCDLFNHSIVHLCTFEFFYFRITSDQGQLVRYNKSTQLSDYLQ